MDDDEIHSVPGQLQDGIPDGDAAGRYGYGRPAHKPDPTAKYGFAPDPKRTLPLSGEIAVADLPGKDDVI